MNKKIIVFSMFATLFLSVYSVDKSPYETCLETQREIRGKIEKDRYLRTQLVDSMREVEHFKESFIVLKKQTVSLAGLYFSTHLPRGPLAMRATAMGFFGLTTGLCALLTVTPRLHQKALIELDKAVDRSEGLLRELNDELAELQKNEAQRREYYENLSREYHELMREREGITEKKWDEKYGK